MIDKISKNENISNFDPHQIQGITFDNLRDAVRVHVVDGIQIKADSITMPEIKFPEQQVIQVPVIVKEHEIHQINVPVIVKETEIKVIEVEKQVIVPEIKIIEIEKPIIIKETQIQIIEKEISIIPLSVKICIALQSLALIGLLILNIIKK